MRVLITGASGFIGSRLAGRLLAERHEVHALLRSTSESAGLPAGVRLHRFSGTFPSLRDAVASAAPEVVLHLAGLFISEHAPEQVDALVEANVLFGTRLLEAMHESGCRSLVYAGTSWQHHHDRPYCPVNLYAATKQAFGAIVDYYADARGLTAVALAIFDTYGEGDPRRKLIPLLLEAGHQGKVLELSPGAQELDLLHVDDVADAFVRAAEPLSSRPSGPGSHREFALSSGRRVTLRELVRLLEGRLEKTIPVSWGGRPYRLREVMRPWSQGERLPGWAPRIPLESGLDRIVADFRSRRA